MTDTKEQHDCDSCGFDSAANEHENEHENEQDSQSEDEQQDKNENEYENEQDSQSEEELPGHRDVDLPDAVCHNENDKYGPKVPLAHLHKKKIREVRKPFIKRYEIPVHTVDTLLNTLTHNYDQTQPDETEIASYNQLMCKILSTDASMNDKDIEDITNDLVKYKCIIKSLPDTISIIKNLFYSIIVTQRKERFVEQYNQIFKDNFYADLKKYYTKMPIIPQDVLDAALATHNKNVADFMKRSQSYLKMPNFYDGQIIGAMDRNDKWWMARVITSVKYGPHKAYYVEFCGWDQMFNEWISDRRRLKYYNRFRHLLYRRPVQVRPS